jgi:hypothetical protein
VYPTWIKWNFECPETASPRRLSPLLICCCRSHEYVLYI